MKNFVIIDREICIGCGACVKDCLSKIIRVEEEVAVIEDFTDCIKCGHCGASCPVDAIRYDDPEYDMNIESFSKDHDLVTFRELDYLIKMKRSCRQYHQKEVESDKLESLLRIGQISPTGGNRQPLKFVVVNGFEKVEALKLMAMETLYDVGQKSEGRYARVFTSILDNYKKTGYDRLFYNAPLVIVIYGDPSISQTMAVDGGIAAGQMTLIGETLGLGSCYIGYLKTAADHNREICNYLGIPSNETIITNIIFGYPQTRYYRSVPREKLKVKYK